VNIRESLDGIRAFREVTCGTPRVCVCGLIRNHKKPFGFVKVQSVCYSLQYHRVYITLLTVKISVFLKRSNVTSHFLISLTVVTCFVIAVLIFVHAVFIFACYLYHVRYITIYYIFFMFGLFVHDSLMSRIRVSVFRYPRTRAVHKR
jgi:hypothetical protein